MRTLIQKICLVFLLNAGLCTLAWAQATPWGIAQEVAGLYTGGPALTSFLQQSTARNTDPAVTYQVLKNARRLQARGLPTEPYLLKANEGLAKGVSPQRLKLGLGRTQRQTEMAGRLVDRAIARGAVVDSPQARRKTVQEFQWALLNQTSPRDLVRMTDQLTPGMGKRGNLSQIGKSVRAYTLKSPSKRFRGKPEKDLLLKGPQKAHPKPAKVQEKKGGKQKVKKPEKGKFKGPGKAKKGKASGSLQPGPSSKKNGTGKFKKSNKSNKLYHKGSHGSVKVGKGSSSKGGKGKGKNR